MKGIFTGLLLLLGTVKAMAAGPPGIPPPRRRGCSRPPVAPSPT